MVVKKTSGDDGGDYFCRSKPKERNHKPRYRESLDRKRFFLKKLAKASHDFSRKIDQIFSNYQLSPSEKITSYIEISDKAARNNNQIGIFIGTFPNILAKCDQALKLISKVQPTEIEKCINVVKDFLERYFKTCVQFKDDKESKKILARSMVLLFKYFDPKQEHFDFVMENFHHSSLSSYLKGLVKVKLTPEQLDLILSRVSNKPNRLDLTDLFNFAAYQANQEAVLKKLKSVKSEFHDLFQKSNLNDQVKLLQYYLRALNSYPSLSTPKSLRILFATLEGSIEKASFQASIEPNYLIINYNRLKSNHLIFASRDIDKVIAKLNRLST